MFLEKERGSRLYRGARSQWKAGRNEKKNTNGVEKDLVIWEN
jgi:hypothetical protein